MRRWLDSLFGRVLLVQAGVALMVVFLVGAIAVRQQSVSLARITAPIWAAALKPVISSGRPLPREQPVNLQVKLLSGPPPENSMAVQWYPRFLALADELRNAGLPLVSIRVSGPTGNAVTWLELQQGAQTSWIGIHGAMDGSDAIQRMTRGFILGALCTLLAAWWLTGRVVRPLADLRMAMRRFAADGLAPEPAASSAPAELRELSQQFAELARQRQSLDEQRRIMLAAISHDLRSPLGRIRMAAELLPEAAGVAERREAIVRNVQLADRLLGTFIDLTRSEDEPLLDRVDLVELAQRVLADEPDIQTQLPRHPAWMQPASAIGLERLLRNLLDNARHHGAAPVEVAIGITGDRLVLTVRDRGPGIAQEERQAMLMPFVRGEASRSRPGTGLGLAIVERTARRHGGKLSLEDAAPGLRVRIEFPREAS